MLIDTRTELPSDSYKSPLKTRPVNQGVHVGEQPDNPFEEMTTIYQHDGMWVVSIYHRATVIADVDKNNAIRRAIRLHSVFLSELVV